LGIRCGVAVEGAADVGECVVGVAVAGFVGTVIDLAGVGEPFRWKGV
jgi:hypothetical protein